MVIQQALFDATQRLKAADIPQPRLEANLLLQHLLKVDRLGLLRMENEDISDVQTQQYFAYVERRCNLEPTAYILGEKEFMSLNFCVSPAVLIPRPDTEVLCEAVLERAKNYEKPEILDLCCGSGCIGISLAHYLPETNVTLMDLSEEAVEIAKRNAQALAPKNTKVCSGDAFALQGQYDIIVSNPPYIETEVISTLQRDVCFYEPHMALDGGADGMRFYIHFAKIFKENLKDSGLLAMEVGHTQAGVVASALRDEGWCNVEILSDLAGVERVVLAYKN